MTGDAPGPSNRAPKNLQELRTNSLRESDSWLSLNPPAVAPPQPHPPVIEIISSSSEDSIPISRIPSPPITEITSSPSTSTGSIPVIQVPKRRVLESAIEISTSPSIGTSSASLPFIKFPQSPFAEISTSPRASPAAVRRNEGKRKRPAKQVAFVEVTVVEPPTLGLNTANEFAQMLSRIEWRKAVVDLLPQGLLVPAPQTRGRPGQQPVQRYNPCTWQEFIERTAEEEKRKADVREDRAKRFKRTEVQQGVPDPIGSVRHAILEIYGERFEAVEFGKYNLFDRRELLWLHD